MPADQMLAEAKREFRKMGKALRNAEIQHGVVVGCSVDDCDRAATNRLLSDSPLCPAHYQRIRLGSKKTGPVGRPGIRDWKEVEVCTADGCKNPSRISFSGRRFCQLHYARIRRGADLSMPVEVHGKIEPGSKCSVDGCEIDARYSTGLCEIHYRRNRQGRRMDGPVDRSWCSEWWFVQNESRLKGWQSYSNWIQERELEKRGWQCERCGKSKPRSSFGVRFESKNGIRYGPYRRKSCAKCFIAVALRGRVTWSHFDKPVEKKCGCGLPRLDGKSLCSTCLWFNRIKPLAFFLRGAYGSVPSSFLKPCIGCGGMNLRVESSTGYCSQKCYDASRRRKKKLRDRLAGWNREGDIRLEVFTLAGYVCWLCGRKTDPELHYLDNLYPTEDHVFPVSRGGRHSLDNVRCACRQCNQWKHDRLYPDETGPSPYREAMARG